MKSLLIGLAAILAVSGAGTAVAKDYQDLYTMPEVVVTGERPIKTEVVEVKESTIENAADLIEEHVGLIDYGNLKVANISGAPSNQTLVLFDGFPLPGPSDLTGFTSPHLSKVVISKNPCSALDGSGSNAGSINLLPKKTGDGLEILTQISNRGDGISVNFGDGNSSTNYDQIRREGDRKNSKYKKEGFSFFGNSSNLEMGFGITMEERGVPGHKDFPSETAEQKDVSSFFSLRHDGTRLFVYNWDQEYNDEGLSITDDSSFTRFLLEERDSVDWDKGFSFTYGGDVICDNVKMTDKDGESKIGGNRTDVNSGVFLRYDSDNSDVMHTGTVRLDIGNGEVVSTGMFGIEFKISPELRAGFSTSSGFRRPSVNDLYYSDPYAEGNPDLNNETSRSLDMWFDYQGGPLTINTRTFSTTYDNLISWMDSGNYVWRPYNVVDAKIAGQEIGFSYGFGDFTLASKGELIQGRDLREGKELVYTPNFTTHSSLGYSGLLDAEVSYRTRSSAYVDAENTRQVDGFGIVDAKISKDLDGVILTISGENLGDKKNEIIEGYPIDGTTFTLSAAFDF